MVLIKDKKFRKALINHRKELTLLKEKINELSKLNKIPKISIQKSTYSDQEERINYLEKELKTINERYFILLEKLLDLIGNWKSEISNSISNSKKNQLENSTNYVKFSKKHKKSPDFDLNSYQLLFLLDKSKANSPDFAVSSNQLKTVFNINKSEKTIRNKLLFLEKQGFVSVIGQKPKKFFLTQAGLSLISQEQNKVFHIK